MIGTPQVAAAVEHESSAPLRNGHFANGLDGWTPASLSGPWSVDGSGAVHPGAATTFGDVGLYATPDNMMPLPAESTRHYTTVTGYSPVAGTVTLGVSRAGSMDDDAPSMAKTSDTLVIPAGAFTFTEYASYSAGTYRYIGPGFAFRPTVTSPAPDLSTFTVTELTMTRTDPTTDITCLVDRVSVRHGRDDATGQPDASSATIDLSFDTAEDPSAAGLFGGLEIGGPISVAVVFDGITYPRFVGNVTDMSVGWDDAGTETPTQVVAQVLAVSPLATLGRTVIGDTPWPLELDGTRAGHIFVAATQKNVGTDFEYQADIGTVTVLAKDVDSQPALELLQSVAESAEGIVWQRLDGTVCYGDANRRIETVPDLTLDACDLLVSPAWKRDLSGLVNSVSIGWGDPGEGEQNRYLASDQQSIGAYGLYDYSVSTELAVLADAVTVAQDMLARQASPSWGLSVLPVGVADLDAERTAQLLALDMNSLVALTGLPVTGATPDAANLWVEGWAETLEAGAHALDLAVSDYARSAGAVTWDTWGAGTWDATPASLTWNAARTKP